LPQFWGISGSTSTMLSMGLTSGICSVRDRDPCPLAYLLYAKVSIKSIQKIRSSALFIEFYIKK